MAWRKRRQDHAREWRLLKRVTIWRGDMTEKGTSVWLLEWWWGEDNAIPLKSR